MSSDYDLVIIGATAAGIYAAELAARQKARVALVTQGEDEDEVWRRAGAEIRRSPQFCAAAAPGAATSHRLAWRSAQPWVETVIADQQALTSPALLAALGVDYIAAMGEFCRKPHPGWLVDGRLLRSRAYLIATSAQPMLPPIPGLTEVDYLTPDQVWPTLPQDLVILGADPVGVEVAQAGAHLGAQVTLIVDEAMILPGADPAAAFLVQAQLEADGVQVLTQTAVTQVRQIDGKIWVQAGHQAIAADALLLATTRQLAVASLNLAAMGVSSPQPITAHQQTTNPQIYVCGSSPDCADRAALARHEVRLVLRHLGLAPAAPDRAVPQTVLTQPELAWIGLTEPQAQSQLGQDLLILSASFKTNPKAQLWGTTTGFCKLLVRHNGTIVGAHLIGPDASELIVPIALAMQQNLKVQTLANLAVPSATLAAIITQTAQQWQLQRHIKRQNVCLKWLNSWRYSWRSWWRWG
jgi:pyruvate/2-oxoglutarate dehydrogenase complex dihydrolipoamide dehydrogenase (E3) component